MTLLALALTSSMAGCMLPVVSAKKTMSPSAFFGGVTLFVRFTVAGAKTTLSLAVSESTLGAAGFFSAWNTHAGGTHNGGAESPTFGLSLRLASLMMRVSSTAV